MEMMNADQLKEISISEMSDDTKKIIELIYASIIHMAYRGIRYFTFSYREVFDIPNESCLDDYHENRMNTICKYFEDLGFTICGWVDEVDKKLIYRFVIEW